MKKGWEVHPDEIKGIIKIALHAPLSLIRLDITCSCLKLDLPPVLFPKEENSRRTIKRIS